MKPQIPVEKVFPGSIIENFFLHLGVIASRNNQQLKPKFFVIYFTGDGNIHIFTKKNKLKIETGKTNL